MTIGQLSEKTGLTAKTLRFYEEVGVLVSQRTASGWRVYDESALFVLELTKVGKRLGMPLKQIARWVEKFRDPDVPNDELRKALQPDRQRISDEIAELQRAQFLLDTLVNDCPFRRCPE